MRFILSILSLTFVLSLQAQNNIELPTEQGAFYVSAETIDTFTHVQFDHESVNGWLLSGSFEINAIGVQLQVEQIGENAFRIQITTPRETFDLEITDRGDAQVIQYITVKDKLKITVKHPINQLDEFISNLHID